MGLYIETNNKLSWLNNHGVLATVESAVKNDEFLVCWIDNKLFQAVGVAFNDEALKIMSKPDPRTKLWFIVKKDKLKEVCPEWNKYVKEEKIERGISATFEDTGDGVIVSATANANQEEVEALIKSLINMIAEGNKIHVTKVLMDISMDMMTEDLGKGNNDCSIYWK